MTCDNVWGQAHPVGHVCICKGPDGHPVDAEDSTQKHWCPCGNWWPQAAEKGSSS